MGFFDERLVCIGVLVKQWEAGLKLTEGECHTCSAVFEVSGWIGNPTRIHVYSPKLFTVYHKPGLARQKNAIQINQSELAQFFGFIPFFGDSVGISFFSTIPLSCLWFRQRKTHPGKPQNVFVTTHTLAH